jgi:glutamine synthetase
LTSPDKLIERIAQGLDRLKADVVHVGVFDYATIFRERRLKREELLVGAPTAVFANVLPRWDSAESIIFPGPYGSETVVYDSASLRPYPFEPNAATMVADYTGAQKAIMPRQLLADQIVRAGKLGIDVLAAYEFEFVILEETAESLRGKGFANLAQFAPDNRCWSGQMAATHADFVTGLETTLSAADIGVHSLGFEHGPGCLEVTLKHKSAMRAADDMAFCRLFTKAHTRRQGKTASFMPYLGDGFPGIGCHIALSLRDRESGRNVFADPTAEHGLSSTARSFLAGVIDTVPEAFAMLAHTVNAYRRLAPGSWAPKTVSWAPYNYAAALRTAAETPETTRLECRLPGSDVNPYLGLALLIGAGLDGLERQLTLTTPPMRGGGPAEIPEGVPRLPVDLLDATRRLRASGKARALFGAAFVEHFSTVCEFEDNALRKAVSPKEVERYLEAG